MAAIGLVFVALGSLGVYLKADHYRVKRFSYTGHPLRWGPYLLLIVGVVLILRGIIVDIGQ